MSPLNLAFKGVGIVRLNRSGKSVRLLHDKEHTIWVHDFGAAEDSARNRCSLL